MTDETQSLLVERELLYKRVSMLEELLRRALPFVELHFFQSAAGFGRGAQDLMNKIKAALGMK